MSKCLVTGAAGFVGSHLVEALLSKGHEVIGLDAFIPYYPRSIKEASIADALEHSAYRFVERDLRTDELDDLVAGCDVIFHLAAMAGLMLSWSDVGLYSSCNVLGTARLLEAANKARIPHFIHISTSSAYGKEACGPEDSPLNPFSPYGITKLAAEQLCRAYETNFGLPITILRYFSVYGPRQRPDMAYNILIRKLMNDEPFTLFGDGEQTRSNTYVTDGVAATISAFEQRDNALGEVFNVGGGQVVSLNEVIALLEELTGHKAIIERKPPRPGDQKHTAANVDKARSLLGYNPHMNIQEGLRNEVHWLEENLGLFQRSGASNVG